MDSLEPWFYQLSDLPEMPYVHNLFSRYTEDGQVRLSNLKRYFTQMLDLKPRFLLVGEAPGYQGMYRTGVPFCSESIMLGHKNRFGIFGGAENGYHRVYEDERIWKEPSATVVQRTLDKIDQPMLIWNAFPLHPYQPGDELSNRAPNSDEITIGGKLLKELIEIIQPEQVVAVGNEADNCLKSLGVKAVKVRHPSHGGALIFQEQLAGLTSS